MKVLALVTGTALGAGGIERYNRDFLTALASSPRVKGTILVPRIWGEEGMEATQKRTRNKIGYTLSVLRLLQKEGPFNIIFCGHLHLVFFAALLAKFKKSHLWLQLYGIEAWHKPSPLVRWAAEQADWVTSVSRYTRRRFLQWAGVAPEKVKVIPGAVDEKFSPGPKLKRLIEHHGLDGKAVLLTLSRLSAGEQYKGQDRIIQIMPRLLQKHPNLVYVIAGDGDDRPRLETLAHEKGLDGYVRFIGKVPESELPDLYRMADLFVMPSTGEGFGIAFLEAVACGVPAVGGNRDGSVDALQEGRMGQLVDPNDSTLLTQAILRGLNSPCSQKTESRPLPFSKKQFSGFVNQLLLTMENKN